MVLLRLFDYQGALTVRYHRQRSFYRRRLFAAYHENLYGTEHYLHMTAENSRGILDKMEEFNRGLFPEVPE